VENYKLTQGTGQGYNATGAADLNAWSTPPYSTYGATGEAQNAPQMRLDTRYD